MLHITDYTVKVRAALKNHFWDFFLFQISMPFKAGEIIATVRV